MTERVELKITVAVGAERLAQIERRADAGAMLIERVARLEEQVAGARAQLARIEAKLDRAGGE